LAAGNDRTPEPDSMTAVGNGSGGRRHIGNFLCEANLRCVRELCLDSTPKAVCLPIGRAPRYIPSTIIGATPRHFEVKSVAFLPDGRYVIHGKVSQIILKKECRT